MDLQFIRLIGERREDLWSRQQDFSRIFGQAGAPLGPLDHLAFLREKRGEKIVALEPASGAILGWVGAYPDRDEAGPFFHLAGIEVHQDHRGRGIGTALMAEARLYVISRKASRLKFGTSPLLTANAALYITRYGTRYRWKEGVHLADGRPWPYVSCECDFDDPLARTLDLAWEEVEALSVVAWEGERPVPRSGIVYSGTLTMLLPAFTNASLAHAFDTTPGFLETLYDAFDRLFLHGYGFAWFDRLPDGTGRCCYVMKRRFAL